MSETAASSSDDRPVKSAGKTGKAAKPTKPAKKAGLFARIALFIRQVISEMRKVVSPTRKELVNYTLVVLVFVAIMMVIVSGLDFGFGKAVLWIFGGAGPVEH